MLGDNWSYFSKQKILERWLNSSVLTLILDNKEDLVADLKKSTIAFITHTQSSIYTNQLWAAH